MAYAQSEEKYLELCEIFKAWDMSMPVLFSQLGPHLKAVSRRDEREGGYTG